MATTADTAPGRVLVVDDELLIRWAISEALADQGFIVSDAPDGTAALRALSDGSPPPDVVLLDYRLPDSNDLTLLSKVITLVPRGRVILMTAYGAPDMIQAAIERGAFSVVHKPFELQALAALVARARA
jgi:two-component system nitrogen regulation response regulator GlnG